MPFREQPSEPTVELREELVTFLTELRPEEIELLRASIAFVRSWRTILRFLKWTLGAALAVFLAMAGFGNALVQLKSFWTAFGASH